MLNNGKDTIGEVRDDGMKVESVEIGGCGSLEIGWMEFGEVMVVVVVAVLVFAF